MQCHKKADPHRKPNKPEAFKATGPRQVWIWDITFLASTVIGRFYRLYLVMYYRVRLDIWVFVALETEGLAWK